MHALVSTADLDLGSQLFREAVRLSPIDTEAHVEEARAQISDVWGLLYHPAWPAKLPEATAGSGILTIGENGGITSGLSGTPTSILVSDVESYGGEPISRLSRLNINTAACYTVDVSGSWLGMINPTASSTYCFLEGTTPNSLHAFSFTQKPFAIGTAMTGISKNALGIFGVATLGRPTVVFSAASGTISLLDIESLLDTDSVWVEPAAFEPSDAPSQLANAITAAHDATVFDPEEADVARAALADAKRFVNAYLPDAEPSILWSDDGLLTLQWRKDRRGLIVIFPGDNTATYSIKEPGGFYSANGREFPVTAGLPAEISKFLAA
jgi:hypothetical protein